MNLDKDAKAVIDQYAKFGVPPTESMSPENARNAPMMTWFWKHYLENQNQGSEQYASPLQAQSLRGLPPAIVITAENDPLRDEGEAYAKRLADEGVSVDLKRFEGVTHEFFGLAGVVDKATVAVGTVAEGLKRIFDLRASSVNT